MAPNVKFPRKIRRGNSGKDVLAHKRAISRARPDFYPWHDFTPYAGDKFMRAVIKWKKSRGMNSQPIIGKTAHERLERTHRKDHPKQWAFDPQAQSNWQVNFGSSSRSRRKEKCGIELSIVGSIGTRIAAKLHTHRLGHFNLASRCGFPRVGIAALS